MAMCNARSLKNALKTFFKENGREPNLEEFRKLVTGHSGKTKNDSSKKVS
jgi:hypothetical protein